MLFKDRTQAGSLLAEALKKYAGEKTVVYALPRGGVVLGYEISKLLGCPLDLIVTRKIGHPGNAEYAVCAVSENSPPIYNADELYALDKDWLEAEVSDQRKEIKRRKKLYPSQGIDAKDKIAIVVDDGIATGLTLESALAEIKAQGPETLIAAVPVAPADAAAKFSPLVDEFVCLDVEDDYLGSVGMYYIRFPQVEDSEVIELLTKANK